LFGRSAAAISFATDTLLLRGPDRELFKPFVDRLKRPQTVPATGWLDARWQWVAGTQLVAQSTERDAQALGELRIFVVCGLGLLPCLYDHLQFDTFDNDSAMGISR
jgi:hypothetical protein